METWLLIVIIAASVLVVGALVWFLFLRKEEEEAEAKTQVVDLAEGKLELAVGEVAYGTWTVTALEDASVTVGDCGVVEIKPAKESDLPVEEEEEGEEAEEEEEEERRRRLREGDDEEEAADTETFYYEITGVEEGECELVMVYSAEEVDLEVLEDLDPEENTIVTVAVTVSAGEGEEAAEEEEEEEE